MSKPWFSSKNRNSPFTVGILQFGQEICRVLAAARQAAKSRLSHGIKAVANNNQCKVAVSLGFLLLAATALEAATVKVDMRPVETDLHDKAALQRGAKAFMNYCSGCHSLKYLRYSTMAKDLGLTTFDGRVDKDLLKNNLIFTSATIHDPIAISMPEEDAREWFGRLPPDLTLSAREKGPEWIYTYLKSFYVDKNRPFGANNLLVPDVSMPNILAPLQGRVIAVKERDAGDNSEAKLSLLLVESGSMSQQQFDSTLQDLVTFLVYASEPNRLTRYRIGFFVLAFLGLLLIPAYGLKKIYWRKVV